MSAVRINFTMVYNTHLGMCVYARAVYLRAFW